MAADVAIIAETRGLNLRLVGIVAGGNFSLREIARSA